MGICEKVLGTVDQLLIKNAIMQEVRDHNPNLAVTYYDWIMLHIMTSSWLDAESAWMDKNREKSSE